MKIVEKKKDIKNYEGLYFCDVDGNIYSYPKKTRKGIRKLKTTKFKTGYLTIDLVKNSNVKKHLVHRLIIETFIDNTENKPQVNHINGDKSDNRLDNLEWSTPSENQKHAILLGLRKTNGENNSQSKLKKEQVIQILHDNRVYADIAKQYNISIPTVCDIKRGYSWTSVTGLKNIKVNGSTKYIGF
jgi:uncharacterized protein YerC